MTRARRPLVRPHGASGTYLAGDSTTTLGLGALAVTVGSASALWVGAALGCLLTGRPTPPGGLLPALVAVTRPRHPASAWPRPDRLPGTLTYWAGTLIVLATVTGAGWFALRIRDRINSLGPSTAKRIRALPGLATPTEVDRAAGRTALLHRASIIRPAYTRTPTTTDLGYRIGTVGGRSQWCSVEDSALVVGPPRMGKGCTWSSPGSSTPPAPVVATSTRPDTLAVTCHARRKVGPVAIFDPQRLAGLPGGLRWSPVRGCETPRTALVRARGLAAGAGFGRTVSDSDFWTGQTESALRCLLHAAALDHRPAADLYRWSLNPVMAEDAITILTKHPEAASGWADALDAAVHADPRTRDGVWMGVRQSLAALADPDVLDAVDPRTGEAFDPAAFLRDSGTLFLLASAVTSGSCAPLVAAFIEDITETARALAARSSSARLDPPLLLALDEIANLTPLPSLPSLMAEGGGTGITTLAVLQSLAQARHRWGEHAADAIWDAATVKVILGGLAKMRDLEDVSRLLGEIDEPTQTLSQGRGGERSSSTSLRMVPVMPPAVLRTLPFGTGVLLLRHTRPAVIDLQPWPSRPDGPSLQADRERIENETRGITSRTPAAPWLTP